MRKQKTLTLGLLLLFCLTSIGQTVYACADIEPAVSHVCCCDDGAMAKHANCPMDMEPQDSAGNCCTVQFESIAADGTKLTSAAQHAWKPGTDFDPGAPAIGPPPSLLLDAFSRSDVIPRYRAGHAPAATGTLTYLRTQRLRI